MLKNITMESFQPHVGKSFRVIVDGGRYIPVELLSVTPWGDTSDGKRQPFTLLFRADRGHAIAQATYTVDTEGLEPFPLFIVPLQPESDGSRYEAVFS